MTVDYYHYFDVIIIIAPVMPISSHRNILPNYFLNELLLMTKTIFNDKPRIKFFAEDDAPGKPTLFYQ